MSKLTAIQKDESVFHRVDGEVKDSLLRIDLVDDKEGVVHSFPVGKPEELSIFQ